MKIKTHIPKLTAVLRRKSIVLNAYMNKKMKKDLKSITSSFILRH